VERKGYKNIMILLFWPNEHALIIKLKITAKNEGFLMRIKPAGPALASP
jgi:hypothetical protein